MTDIGPGLKKQLKSTVRSACWFLYGRAIRNPELPSDIRSVLYVCKGNIVRSPFAEHFSNRVIAENTVKSAPLQFDSAGLVTPDRKASPKEAVITAKQFDVALHDHAPKLINYSMIESKDMIVAMDVWQFKLMKKLFLEHSNKIFLLPLYDSDRDKYNNFYWKYNIVDPYGKSIEQYQDCYKRMSAVIRNFISIIQSSNRQNKGV